MADNRRVALVIVVGVDPGARGTGVVVIDTDLVRTLAQPSTRPVVLSAGTVRRLDDGPVTSPPPAYLVAVADAVREAVDEHAAELVAVEGVTAPTGFADGKRHRIDPSYIIAAGMAFAAVVSRGYGAHLVIVRPGQNGSRPLGTYPDALVSAAERRNRRTVDLPAAERGVPWQLRPAGSGQLKDQRSAYDVAVAGARLRAVLSRLPAHLAANPYTY